jgi:hypothetical protein
VPEYIRAFCFVRGVCSKDTVYWRYFIFSRSTCLSLATPTGHVLGTLSQRAHCLRLHIHPETSLRGQEKGEIVPETSLRGPVQGAIVPETSLRGQVQGATVPEISLRGQEKGEIVPETSLRGQVQGEIVPETLLRGQEYQKNR